jgi:hypothetical protein
MTCIMHHQNHATHVFGVLRTLYVHVHVLLYACVVLAVPSISTVRGPQFVVNDTFPLFSW